MFPKIIIRYNRFLDPVFIAWIQSQDKWKDWVPPKKEEVARGVTAYKIEWRRDEKDILDGLQNAIGLPFVQNVIDVHIVSGNPRQFSNPIIIKSGFHPEEFVQVLSHELIHRLFSNYSDVFPASKLKDILPSDDQLTSNHIAVYAILKYIYIDVLNKPQWLESDKTRCIGSAKNHPQYINAWNIVGRSNYREILNILKEALSAAQDLSADTATKSYGPDSSL